MSTITIVMGYPCAGKTTETQKFVDAGAIRFNRDTEGGSIANLHAKVDAFLTANPGKSVVLDNTYPTVESRQAVIEMAQRHDLKSQCFLLQASIEDAQNNMCARLFRHFGHIPGPDEIKATKDPGIFPPAVLFRYRKERETPDLSEGWDMMTQVEFHRRPYPNDHVNKAVILDYDTTLRETKDGSKYPVSPDNIEIMPNTRRILESYRDMGYLLLGASNQSGVDKGSLTNEDAQACFEETNRLIGVDIEYSYCPHQSRPISCYCRKPMPGMLLNWVWKYKLDPKKTLFVGDYGTDKSAARRAGIPYIDHADFFDR